MSKNISMVFNFIFFIIIIIMPIFFMVFFLKRPLLNNTSKHSLVHRNSGETEKDNIRSPFPKYLHECNEDEYRLLAEGFNHARETGFLSRAARYHTFHFNGAHNNPYFFFPFHGEFISQMNDFLKEYDSRLSLPIWDLRTQPVYPSYFYALTRNWREVIRPLPPNSRIRYQAYQNVQAIPYHASYIDFINYCSWIHNVVHDDYGGTFGSPASPLDPLFWSFHAFWDDVYQQYLDMRGLSRHSSEIPVPNFNSNST